MKIIEALSHVLVCEPLDAFELKDQHVFDENIDEIFSDGVAFIGD